MYWLCIVLTCKSVCCITGLRIHPTDGPIVIQIHPGKKVIFLILIAFLLMHVIQDYYGKYYKTTLWQMQMSMHVCEFLYEVT